MDNGLGGKLHVVGIAGSNVSPSKTHGVVEMALHFVRDAHWDVSTDLICLSDWPLEFCDGRDPALYDGATRALIEKVASANALIVGSPIYRGSYPGVLKNLFDLLPEDALEGKVVGLLATGGSAHHFLAIEQELKPLIGCFRAHAVPRAVYACDGHFVDGALVDEGVIARLHELAETVVNTARRLRRPGGTAGVKADGMEPYYVDLDGSIHVLT